MQDRAGEKGNRKRQSRRKRVVIVDDSATIRNWLRIVFETDSRLEVVGEADSAQQARDVIKRTNPDVVTLDIEMPGMDGMAFLERLMVLNPLPVVMISGATEANSEASIKALSLGAVDCLLKPTMVADRSACQEISRRVFLAARSQVQIASLPVRETARSVGLKSERMPLILVGASTGGVGALETFLADLPADGPPVVIVQHMPGTFLVSFSQLLDRKLPQDVALVREGELLNWGYVRLATAMDQHTKIGRTGYQWHCQLSDEPRGSLHCPSVDVLFHSAVPFGDYIVAVILTGLGRDGADGMKELRRAGAFTLGQDAGTSVVYGMPRAAWESGAVCTQLPLARLGGATADAARKLCGTKG